MNSPTIQKIEPQMAHFLNRTVSNALLLTLLLVLSGLFALPASAQQVEGLDSIQRSQVGSAPVAAETTDGLKLVFFDDFSTDPNTNGLWTIHRYTGNPNLEAVWDATGQNWRLTVPFEGLGVAVFANYDLTATEWKAAFRYRVGKLGGINGGGDGFVFMFYKDKSAYGTPELGMYMGFEVRNGTITPVPGYGLEFDNYDSGRGCDPTPNDYIGLVQDDICNSLAFVEDDRTDDNEVHEVDVRFSNGGIRVAIDGGIVLDQRLPNPDYTFSGIGFGAGTGSAYADHRIDNFKLWVKE